MQVFKYDIGKHKSEYSANGFMNLKNVLTPEFVAYLLEFYDKSMQGDVGLLPKNSKHDQKSQFKFDFPTQECAEEFRDGIASLTGLQGAQAVLAERHLKVYENSAMDFQYPHKDRCASGITVGFPINLGDETALYVFPALDQSENPNETAIYLDDQDALDTFASPEAVRLDQEIGDLVVFAGSTIYHGRIKPAGTAILYCKLNDVGRDPLGEDIFHSERKMAHS